MYFIDNEENKMSYVNKKIIWDDEKKNFYSKVALLVIPMALQNLINVGVTASDVIMLGKVGEIALSASSLAGQIQYIMTLIFFGLASGAAVLTAQYWGKHDIRSIEKIFGIAFRIGIIVAVIFTLAAQLYPNMLMKIYTNEEQVIIQGVKYLKIVSISYCFIAITQIYLNIMRSVEKVVVSTVVYLISLFVNIILNAILIFGLLGFPAMGIEGAAIATLISRTLELVLVIIYEKKINDTVHPHLKDIFKVDKILFKDFMVMSVPVVLNELLWGMGTSANTAVIGHLGSSAVAANSVAQVARQLATVVAFGIANATAIILGKTIGENKLEEAKKYSKRFVVLSIVFGAIGGGIILLSGPIIINAMSLTEQAAHYLRAMLIVMSYFTLAQAFNANMVVGVFRSGGDTKYGLMMDVSTMWGCSILLGAIAAFVFNAPVIVVYVILMSDEIVKIPMSIIRYRSYKWLKNVTRQM